MQALCIFAGRISSVPRKENKTEVDDEQQQQETTTRTKFYWEATVLDVLNSNEKPRDEYDS